MRLFDKAKDMASSSTAVAAAEKLTDKDLNKDGKIG